VLLTSRDYALRLALSLVIATEAVLFALLVLLGGKLVPHVSIAFVIVAAALVGAARTQPRHSWMFAATALVIELTRIPSPHHHGKAITLLAGLHAAHVLTGLLLVAWTLALPRWRRASFARLTNHYWYFVAIAWLVVGPLLSAHRP
jgi:hypothetical protein